MTGHIEIPEGHIWLQVDEMEETHGGRPYVFSLCASMDAAIWRGLSRKDKDAWKERKAADLRFEAERDALARTNPKPVARVESDPFGPIAERMSKLAGLD